MLKVIVGCYEQMLLGYSITKDENEDSKYPLQAELIFTDHSHTGCVKTLACGASFLASGATDETIFLFNMKENREVGSIQGHEGTISNLKFPDKNFLISSSDDGVINAWKVSGKWDKAKSLRGHKGPVASFDVHPSGKLALSVSPKDGTLRTWNMISGRPVYVKNMKKFNPEIIKFSPDGDHYVISSSKCIQIYELESAMCLSEINSKWTVLAVEFISDNLIAVAGESNEIHVYKVATGNLVTNFEAHTSRVKGLHVIARPDFLAAKSDGELKFWLGSASSDGHMKIWEIDEAKLLSSEASVLRAPKCVLDVDTKARLTCLTSWEVKPNVMTTI